MTGESFGPSTWGQLKQSCCLKFNSIRLPSSDFACQPLSGIVSFVRSSSKEVVLRSPSRSLSCPQLPTYHIHVQVLFAGNQSHPLLGPCIIELGFQCLNARPDSDLDTLPVRQRFISPLLLRVNQVLRSFTDFPNEICQRILADFPQTRARNEKNSHSISVESVTRLLPRPVARPR